MHTYWIHFFEEWGNGGGQHTVHHITHLRGSERERGVGAGGSNDVRQQL